MQLLTYIYDWSHEIVDRKTLIQIYSLNRDNETVCLNIHNFKPYFYIELPEYTDKMVKLQWTPKELNKLYEYLNRKIFKSNIPVKYEVKIRKKLYYAHKNSDLTDIYYKYLICYCNTNKEFNSLRYKFQTEIDIPELGSIYLKVHETNVSPILQFACQQDIPMSGWVQFYAQNIQDKKTHCVYEYDLNYDQIENCIEAPKETPMPMKLSFDIEVYSGETGSFPDGTRFSDCVFQISCVFWKTIQDTTTYLLTIGDVDEKIVNESDKVIVQSYADEAGLLIGFIQLFRKYNPQVITGWNILGFDIHYLIQRYKVHHLKDMFAGLGMIKNKICTELDESWSSSAYGKQSFKYYDWNGRIILDLLMFARREIKSENYKLETIASQFLQSHKDPLTVEDIFKGYEEGVLKKSKDGKYKLSLVAKYCAKDSILVERLFQEFDMWIGVTEMSAVCNVPASYLYTKGQQIKVFSQVYKYCYDHKFVVEQNVYECGENERYQGAYVRDPIPGIYEYVVPYDFSSLYPSIIIAYNIDYSTFVMNEAIPDEACHVIEWTEEHEYDVFTCNMCKSKVKGDRSETHLKWLPRSYQSSLLWCEHCNYKFYFSEQEHSDDITIRKDKLHIKSQVFTETFRYRFLKDTDGKSKGVLPSIAENLLEARKNTKKQMKELKQKLNTVNSEQDKKHILNYINILNKRQLSYKISCNSIYGALGVKRGMLPLMPGAMCVTAIGRRSVKFAAEHLKEKHQAHIVYGDTDSVYVQFLNVSKEELWNHARGISKQIYEENIFPKPMALEFEEAVYDPFFILTKKRYMWRYFNEDATRSTQIGNKGVVLARRGTSAFLKKIYERVVNSIFEKWSKDRILNDIIEYLNQCCSGILPFDDFIITKKVGDLESYDDTKSLPAHIRVAELMESRGLLVETGQRLEYVVTTKGGIKAKVTEKAEEISYQKKYSHIIPIDYLYYIHLCTKQLDELLEVAFKTQSFVEQQYTLRIQKSNLHRELKSYFKPKLVFIS
jgi:DNA polymerase elongation subunit (family B)